MTYDKIVRNAIKKTGLTYMQVAEATGYAEFSINSWANAKHKPSYNAVEDICELAGYRLALIDENGKEVIND